MAKYSQDKEHRKKSQGTILVKYSKDEVHTKKQNHEAHWNTSAVKKLKRHTLNNFKIQSIYE